LLSCFIYGSVSGFGQLKLLDVFLDKKSNIIDKFSFMVENSSIALFPNVPPVIIDEAIKESFVLFVD
jgi:hypothetical protein